MASNLVAMASNLVAMAANLLANLASHLKKVLHYFFGPHVAHGGVHHRPCSLLLLLEVRSVSQTETPQPKPVTGAIRLSPVRMAKAISSDWAPTWHEFQAQWVEHEMEQGRRARGAPDSGGCERSNTKLLGALLALLVTSSRSYWRPSLVGNKKLLEKVRGFWTRTIDLPSPGPFDAES